MSTHASSPGQDGSGKDTIGVFFTALRGLGFVMMLLMLLSIAYASWIAILNWDHIKV
ncbi:MAG: hypothetical protein ABIZ91_17940 [Gemmatimonadaceae bacterium]